MSQQYISQKSRFYNAEQFKESFSESSNPTVGYFFVGNSVPYEDANNIPEIFDTIVQEKLVWDNMFAAKKIAGTDLEFVIPRKTYVNTIYYTQYDDSVNFVDLITDFPEQDLKSFFVINKDNEVYKCLYNNNNGISSVEPLGKGEGSRGIITTTDSYIWKYLYTVPESTRFSTNNWIPVPVSTNRLSYSSYANTSVDGEIISVVVANSGNNYYNGNVEVSNFSTSCTILTYSATTDIANNLALNMEVSGNGVQEGTYITNIDLFNRQIYLSYPTESSGGGSGNNIQTLTRSIIIGDGFGAICNTSISNGHVDKIVLTSFGKEYNYASVYVYGTGEDASARAIISPKYGHGFNCAKELGCNTVILNVEVSSDEQISSNTTFRQYGILLNPHKYGEEIPVEFSNAQSSISQTTDITLLQVTEDYEINQFVYQGDINDPNFSGIINEIILDENKLRLIKVKGDIEIGSVLKIANSSVSISVQAVDYPEFQPYSGDIIYTKNIEEIQRSAEQTETIKVIVKF